MPVLRRSVLVVAALLLLQQSAAADIFLVPPPPVPVVLHDGERAVAVDTEFDGAYAPQAVYLQLALLGSPIPATPAPTKNFLVKPGMEDAPPPRLQASTAVRADDISALAALLQAAGIARSDITADLPRTRSGIGVVRIAVRPATASQFDLVASRVDLVMAAYHNIAGSGIIVQAATCEFEAQSRETALREATALASLLARAAQLNVSSVLTETLRSTAGTSNYQTICGPQRAALPMYDEGAPAPGSLHGYPVEIDGGVVFRARPGSAQPEPKVHFVESASASDYFSTLVKHQFIIPDDEPFVSAQGRFSAVVMPDVWVDSIGVAAGSAPPVPARVPDELVSAVRAAGIGSGSIARAGSRILVRVTSARQLAAVQTQLSAVAHSERGYEIYSSTTPFLLNCEPVRAAVAAQAFRGALARAQIMTRAAHLRVGGVIAVNDAGTHDGTLCGYGKNASLKTLLAAIQASSPNLWQIGSASTFSSNVVVAWHLAGAAPTAPAQSMPQFAPPYAYSTMYQAFATHGFGALGEAKREVAPTQAFVSFPFAMQLAPQARRRLKALRWEVTSGGADQAAELPFTELQQVEAAITRLRNAGTAPDHLQLRSTACAREQAAALREATLDAIARAGARPLRALVDQGSVYRPDASICGLSNNVGASGGYIGGSFTGYATAEYSIDERVLAVTTAPSRRQ